MKQRRRWIAAALALVLGIGLLASCRAIRMEEHSVVRTTQSGGHPRSYQLHVPPSYVAGRPTPLVIGLHGGGGRGIHVEWLTGLSALSDREGFIAVYPDALWKHWNDGRGIESSRAHREGIDDVAYLSSLIDELSAAYTIDPKRIYATGISNGGFMSHTLATRLSGRIAAIAPVAGGMGPSIAASFTPEHPVSVLMINGDDDWLVPIGGGEVARKRGMTVDTVETARRWIEHNGCRPEAAEEAVVDRVPDDGTVLKRSVYAGGRGGSEVVLCVVEQGGHTWPGGRAYLPEWIVGKVSREMNATEEIWRFFAAHPKP